MSDLPFPMKRKQFMRQTIWRWFVLQFFSLVAVAINAAETNSLPQFVPPKYSVAILPFENKTGQTNWQHWSFALDEFVSSALGSISALYLVSDDSQDFAFRQLKISPKNKMTSGTARKIGKLLHVKHVLWGNYKRRGEKWLVTVRVCNVGTGKTSKDISAESADWYDVRVQLAEQIFKELEINPSARELEKLRRRPANSAAILELIGIAFATKKTNTVSETEQLKRKFVALDPKWASAHANLATVLFYQGKFDEAEKSARDALALRSDSGTAHATLGTLFAMQMKIAEAEKELLEAVRLYPYGLEFLNRLAEFYFLQQRDAEAAAVWEWIEQLDPNLSGVHAKLGQVYALKGELKKARAELAEAERLQMDDSNTEQQLCLAYKTLHDAPKALKHAEEFIRLAKEMSDSSSAWFKEFEAIRKGIQLRSVPSFVEATEPKVFTAQSLNDEMRARLNEEEMKLATNPLLSSPEMKRWAEEQTRGATNDFDKCKKLFDALVRRVNAGQGGQRNARQVFADWQNPKASFKCQEFAVLYVALARAVGLKAYMVGVERDYRDDQVTHGCAGVLINGKALLADPAYEWFGAPHKKFSFVNDLQFLAIYLAQLHEVEPERIALKLQPDLALAQFNLFFDLCKKEDFKEAAKELDKGLEMDSKSGLSYVARGYWEYRNGRFQLAAHYFRESLDLERDGKTQFLLADTFVKQRRWDEALTELRGYLQDWPSDQFAGEARKLVLLISEKNGRQ